MYILNLNIGLKIFVIMCNMYGVYVTVFIEKVTVNCTRDPLLGLGRLMRKGQQIEHYYLPGARPVGILGILKQ